VIHVRVFYLLALAAAAYLLLASQASARTDTYYYGWIDDFRPVGACPYFAAGTACDGWNYWDYSQLAFRNVAYARIGFIFRGNPAVMYWKDVFGIQNVKTVVWNTSAWGGAVTHYNKAACSGRGANSEALGSCQALIFP
jgi:hypothetical protein